MKHRIILICTGILLFASACTPSAQPTDVATQAPVVSFKSVMQTAPAGSPAVPPTAVRPTTPPVEPTLVPNPLNVTVKLDDRLAASAVISSTGGTVSVKAADGTQFTLSIPKNALFGDERITLTPVTGAEGLPFSGGLVGALQMSPEGLRLYQQANLTIESPKANPAKGYDLIAFAYHQNGEGFYLTPSQVEGNRITIPVWHFSGGGAAQGTPTEIQAQQRRVPANAEDAFRQRMQDYLGRERQAQLLTGNADPEFAQKMTGFLREAYQSFIAPQLPLAAKDCEAAREILSRAIGWARQVELMGLHDEFSAEIENIWQTFADALVNCYNKAYDKCVAEDDLSQIAVMMGYLRQATLLSPAEGGGLVSRLDQSKIEKCGSFNLQFDNTISADATLYFLDYTARAAIPLNFRLPGGLPSGEAQIELSFKPRSGNADGYYKFLSSGAKGGALQASVSLFSASSEVGGSAEPIDLIIRLKPGMNTEHFTAQYCVPIAGCGADFGSDDPGWTIFFQFLHEDESGAGGFEIRNWTRGSGAVIAHKTYNRTKSYAGHPVQETTTLQLIHRAQ